jgi:predicted secreted protein
MADEVVSEVGRVFDVELREPATSGYRWSIVSLPPGIQLVDERRQTQDTEQIGGALRHTFQLKATDPGRYRVSFQLKRQWEPKSVEVKTVKVSVHA